LIRAVASLFVIETTSIKLKYGLIFSALFDYKTTYDRSLIDPRLGTVRDISASTLMDDGSPVLIVDVSDLVRSIDNALSSGQLSPVDINKAKKVKGSDRKGILVVDDSITVREMTRKLLQYKIVAMMSMSP
jgi:two-component system sensor histidine kinase and response regulator WspE